MISFSEYAHFLCIFRWQDYIEISIISIMCYRFLLFLTADKQQNLLSYVLFYVFLISVSHFFNFVALELLILIIAPALISFFVLIHQEQLQKNFVALYRIDENGLQEKKIWHPSLIQWCQKQASKGISTSYILEHTENLESVLNSYIPCHTLFSSSFLEVIYESPLFFSNKPILIEYNGIIKGLNVNYTKHPILHTFENIQVQELFITGKTDALIMHMHADTLTFTCFYNNQQLTHLSAHMMSCLLDTFFEIPSSHLQGKKYEHFFTKKENHNHSS